MAPNGHQPNGKPPRPQLRPMSVQERNLWAASHNLPPGILLIYESEMQRIQQNVVQANMAMNAALAREFDLADGSKVTAQRAVELLDATRAQLEEMRAQLEEMRTELREIYQEVKGKISIADDTTILDAVKKLKADSVKLAQVLCPDPALKGSFPVVLYFTTRAEADEMLKMAQAANGNLTSKDLPS